MYHKISLFFQTIFLLTSSLIINPVKDLLGHYQDAVETI